MGHRMPRLWRAGGGRWSEMQAAATLGPAGRLSPSPPQPIEALDESTAKATKQQYCPL